MRLLLGLLTVLGTGTIVVRVEAQQIAGRVTDSLGTPIPEARVTVLEANRSTVTDAEGHYLVPDLPTGTFGVSVAAIGFAPIVRRVVVRGPVTLDVMLRRSLVELPDVQVTASPLASASLNSPQPTSVLSSETLADAQAPSLGETLEVLPGLRSWSTGPGIGKPVIRGVSGSRVLVLADGQRTETQQWGDEHSPNVETAGAERIEVIRGPASVLYGSDALGGLINVVPRELPDATGRSAIVRGRVVGTYRSASRSPDGAFMIEGGQGRVGFRGSLAGRTSGDVRTPHGPLFNSENETLSGSGAVGVRGSWGSLVGSFVQRNERIEIHENPAEDPGATPFQRIADSRARVSLMLPVGAGSRLESHIGFQRNNRREFEDAAASDDEVAVGLLSRSYTADLHYHHPALGRWVGLVGVQGIVNGFARYGEELLIPETDAYNIGVFAFEQAEYGRFILSAGARFEHRRLEVSEGIVGRETRQISVTEQTRTYNSLTGNLGALFRVSDRLAVVANIGRGFRAPSTFDLFSYGVHEGTLQFDIGDPTLGNETSLNTDLAVRIESNALAGEIAGFVNLVDGFIFPRPTGIFDADPADPEASGNQEYRISQGDARFIGFEANLDWHPEGWIELHGGADYVWAENRTLDQPLPWIPPFRVTYGARAVRAAVGPLSDGYLSLSGETNARQTRVDPNELSPGVESPPGYTIVSIGGGFAVPVATRRVAVDLTVTNLFDKTYTRFLSRYREYAIDQGRNVVLRVSTDF
jgi:outer membrane receptor protein involved in Fe transport